MTPGAVSQQIRLLEDHLGVKLFERRGRGLALAEAGRAGAGLASEAFELLERSVSAMRQPLKRHRLTVSVPPSFAGKWLAPRLHRFQAEHEEVEVWVSADTQRVDLAGGDADLAIRYGPGGDPSVNEERLMAEEVLPVCSPDLLRAGPKILSPRDLDAHTLLHDASPESAVDGADWTAWLQRRRIRLRRAAKGLRFNQSALVIDAAVAGRGVALAKRVLAQADLASGRLVSLFPDGADPVRSAYHLVSARSRPPGVEARAFIDWVRREAGADADAADEL